MKRKVFVVAFLAFTAIGLSSCSSLADAASSLDGVDAQYNGYTLVGKASGGFACISACQNAGYKYYRYNAYKRLCYCK
jgi:hypothetical protein